MNKSKQSMYAATLKKRDKAYREEFYYETILLDYALLEDRINDFLGHLGILNGSHCDLKVAKQVRKPIRCLLALNDNAQFGIKKISVKLDIVKKLTEYVGEDEFLADLHSLLIGKIGSDDLHSLIQEIRNWKDDRNVIVHGLLNRVPGECDTTVKQLADNGKTLFRQLDKYCRRIEKCGIRRKYRIQPLANYY